MNIRNISPLFLREIIEAKKLKKLEGIQRATSFWDSQATHILDWNSILLKVHEQLGKKKKKKTTFLYSPTALKIVQACSFESPIPPTDHYQECLYYFIL